MKNKELEQVGQLLDSKAIGLRHLQELLQPHFNLPKIVKARRTARYKFGIVSDTHLVDKACAVAELRSFYKLCKAEGITEVVHAGDMMTGMYVYKGQVMDLLAFGLEDHLKYTVENYPCEGGLTTYFIGGNHDEDYQRNFGVDPGRLLASQRPDMKYLGMYDGDITLNGVKIGLHHGDGSAPYALSYKLQKFVEKIGAGQKPQIYVLGHYHAVLYMFYRNIHCFLPGCWQRPNNYSVRRGFPNMIGGWIVDLRVANDEHHTITEIGQKFVPFY